MSLMESDGLSASDLMESFGESTSDRGIFGQWVKHPTNFNSSMTTIVIICIVLAAVTAVFFGCYFLLRFIHRALGADGRKHSTTLPYSNVVIHSKRVYEIQAEEGCFTGPPDIHDPVEEPNKPAIADDRRSMNGSLDHHSRQGSLKKPETGDLKTIRQEHEVEDPRQMLRRKEKKVHKDSVCAFLFKPGTEPRMI